MLRAWEDQGITTLLPIQRKAIEAGCLSGRNLLVLGPTSCGKTFVGEIAAVKNALAMKRTLYLVPFKALAEEKHAEFRQKYGGAGIGAEVLISTADRRDDDRRLPDGDFHIAILTYEKLSALLVYGPSILDGLGTVVIDEVQMIGDETRGAELELLVTRIRQVAPRLQLLGLSAAVSELNGFDTWLGATVVRDESRPVPLREGVVVPSGEFTYVQWRDENRRDGTERLPAVQGNSHEDLGTALVSEMLREPNAQILVFVSSVRATQEYAQAVAQRAAFLAPAAEAKRAIAALEQTESTEQLARMLDRSVAFHNADLTIEERLAVEAGFRAGTIRCIVSTSTLSMGVNLPASTVVIAEHTKWSRNAGGWGRPPITVAEYRNMSGRAGRFGLKTDSFGRSVLIAESALRREALMNQYINAVPEPLESAFLKQPLDVRVLRVIASGLAPNIGRLRGFLLATFAATRLWTTRAARTEMCKELDRVVDDLCAKELVSTQAGGGLSVTPLGRVCAASGLRVATFDRIRSLATSGNQSIIDLVLIASQCDDTGPDV
ncbi:MAG: DEAD/DEAH box helicase [Bryobacteraceae bacterium]